MPIKQLIFGLEIFTIYYPDMDSARETANWFKDMFGFEIKEDVSGFLVEGNGSVFLKITHQINVLTTRQCELAIRVNDLDRAIEELAAKDMGFEGVVHGQQGLKTVRITNTPTGIRVHLIFRPSE